MELKYNLEFSSKEVDLLLESLKRYGDNTKDLYNKIWCWKMNYGRKNSGLS